MKRKLIVTCFLTFFLMVILSCEENNNKSGSLRAVLSVQESPNVPARIELDPRGSRPGAGQKLVSFTTEVTDTSTGETVFGPETVSANSDSALLREYFSSGDYLATLTVTATNVAMGESTSVRNGVLEQQITDIAEKMFLVDAIIAFPEADSCEATCSVSTTNPDLTVCTLPTDCFTLGLVNDVLNKAQSIESGINESTTMWIQAYGGSGGDGTRIAPFGPDGGAQGDGGFAQTITSVAAYDSTYSTTTVFYYLGEAGSHDDSGGSGGGSTIVTSVEPQSGNPITLDTLILLAGGGGGGGEGFAQSFDDGTNGGGGGFAYSSTVGDSDTGIGGSESSGSSVGGTGGGGYQLL